MGAVRLDMHNLHVEKKLLLSLLSIKRSLGSKKDGSDWQMMPEVLNKVFLA